MQQLAFAVLRLYPSPWRFRYELEVRALLEEHPPSVGDVLNLAWGALSERLRSLVDPVAHPFFSSVIVGLAGWLTLASAVHIGASVAGLWLNGAVGQPPTWLGLVANSALLIAFARVFVANSLWAEIPLSIQLKPLSRVAARRWFVLYVLAYTCGMWADHAGSRPGALGLGFAFFASIWFLESTEFAWNRRRALKELFLKRRAFLTAVQNCTERSRAADVTPTELAQAAAAVSAARADLERARVAYSASTLSYQPPSRPLGL